MYHVVVRMKARPDKADALVELASFNSRNSRQEPGNLRFDVIRGTTDPLSFALYEVYQDEEAFKAHQQTTHYARWKAEIDGLLAEPRQSERYLTVAPQPYA
jgi:(4S)-4-hydroxy-5-phosphonooxypentane-2,3-dione isomerase